MNRPLPSKRPTLKHPVRLVTATSLFDGHDASINIMRRIMQVQGAEVVHLGHDRGVEEIVDVAIQEDAQGIAVSSYQGGHNEFFRYMVDLLHEKGASHIQVFGGGGGVIIPREIQGLMDYGVSRIYSPEDGRQLGLEGMIADMLERADFSTIPEEFTPDASQLEPENVGHVAQSITWVEENLERPKVIGKALNVLPENPEVPVVGLTGTGGSGKSCLTDEIVRRFLLEFPEKRIAVVSVDPSKRKSGGALLGDRLRMNAVNSPRVFMRSLATRRSHLATSESLQHTIRLLRAARYDLVLVETAGIGQSDSEITDLVDFSIYVMTPEFGAATQLEKIDMLDFADCIVVNKFDKPGAEDALNAVRKQYRRSHALFEASPEAFPVFGVVASRFNDPGTNWFYKRTLDLLLEQKPLGWERRYTAESATSTATELIPAERKDYLRRITATVRDYKAQVQKHAEQARELDQLHGALRQLGVEGQSSKGAKFQRAAGGGRTRANGEPTPTFRH